MSPDRHHPVRRDDAPIALAGAGLSGSLMAAYLAQRGYPVEVFEYRDDFREAGFVGGRSINLALSTRGLTALGGVGLEQRALAMSIPMRGRMMHSVTGELTFQPYGLADQHINSISRAGLNELLVDRADSFEQVNFHFGTKVVDVDLDTGRPLVESVATGEQHRPEARLTIGADGAFSKVRQRLQKAGRFDYEQDYLSHGYKELSIPPAPDGGHRIEREALHIWPRHNFMLIALPNLDGSFTVTLFLPFEGEASFEALDDAAAVERFFEAQFPDALALMPTLVADFFDNPTGSLVTIRCQPYHYDATALIIGDAAHAVVPFYGQGMNAAFEDTRILNDLLDAHDDDWPTVMAAFSRERKNDADAIADLALHNYVVMRSAVAEPNFLWRKKLERKLHELFPERFVPLYSMVTFSNIPYAEAVRRAAEQDRMLDRVWPAGAIDALERLTGLVR